MQTKGLKDCNFLNNFKVKFDHLLIFFLPSRQVQTSPYLFFSTWSSRSAGGYLDGGPWEYEPGFLSVSDGLRDNPGLVLFRFCHSSRCSLRSSSYEVAFFGGSRGRSSSNLVIGPSKLGRNASSKPLEDGRLKSISKEFCWWIRCGSVNELNYSPDMNRILLEQSFAELCLDLDQELFQIQGPWRICNVVCELSTKKGSKKLKYMYSPFRKSSFPPLSQHFA